MARAETRVPGFMCEGKFVGWRASSLGFVYCIEDSRNAVF